MKMKINIIPAVAVFFVFLFISLPAAIAQPLGGAITVNIRDSNGVNQIASTSLPTPNTFANKEIKVTHDTSFSTVDLKVKITPNAKNEIKKGFIFFCKEEKLDDCLRKTKTPVAFQTEFEGQRSWKDVSNVETAGVNKYPQEAKILTILNLNAEGRNVWVSYFDVVKRIDISQFNVLNNNLDSIDLVLQDDSLANLTAAFVQNSFMVPAKFVKETILGGINKQPVLTITGSSFDQTDAAEQFGPPTVTPANRLKSGLFTKQFNIQIPASASAYANPVTLFNNPPPACGNNAKETDEGETEANCCRDIGCSKAGEICSFLQSDKTDPGVCINPNNTTLIVKKLPTSFTSCEVSHDVNFVAEVTKAPADLQATEFFMEIGGETNRDIECTKTVGARFECEFSLDPIEGCRKGSQSIKNNTLFATMIFAGGSKKLNLQTKLPDFSINQQANSMIEISDFIMSEYGKTFDDLKSGIHQSEKLIKTCTKFIQASVIVGAVGAFAVALGALIDLTGGVVGAIGGIKGAFGGGGGAATGTAKAATFTDLALLPRKIINFEAAPATAAKPASETAGQTVVNIGQGANQAMQGYTAQMASAFGQLLGTTVSAGLNICQAASLILQIQSQTAAALNKFTQYQTCVMIFENRMGNGLCNGNNPKDPLSSIQASEACVSSLNKCTTHLDDATQKLDQFDNFASKKAQDFASSVPGSRKVDLWLEDGNGNTIGDTCNDKPIKIGYKAPACISADYTVTSALRSIGATTQTIQSTILPRIRTDVSRLNIYANELLTPPAGRTSALIQADAAKAAGSIKSSSGSITGLTADPDILRGANIISAAADQIITDQNALDNPLMLQHITTIQTGMDIISSKIQSSASRPDDITSIVNSFVQTFKSRKASDIFRHGDGDYEISYTCKDVGSAAMTIKYTTKCPGEATAPSASPTTGTQPSTTKAPFIAIAPTKNERLSSNDVRIEWAHNTAIVNYKVLRCKTGKTDSCDLATEIKATASDKLVQFNDPAANVKTDTTYMIEGYDGTKTLKARSNAITPQAANTRVR